MTCRPPCGGGETPQYTITGGRIARPCRGLLGDGMPELHVPRTTQYGLTYAYELLSWVC